MLVFVTIFISSSTFLVSATPFGYDTGSDVTVTTNTFTGNLTNLSEMEDVNIPTPSNNDLLTFNSATNLWESSAGSSAEPLWNANSSTVARTGNCTSGQFVQNITTGGVECLAVSGITNNSAGVWLNFSQINSDDWTNVTITESQVTDLKTYVENNTGGWVNNFSLLKVDFFRLNGFRFNFIQVASNLILNVSTVTGINYFGIDTEGTFLQLYANPGPANDDLMFTIAETQGADTDMNFYEGGTGNNRLWSSGSGRFGGAKGSLCSTLTTDVDCDTPGTGSDLVVEDDGWFGGKLFASEWDNVTLTSSQVSDFGSSVVTSVGNYTAENLTIARTGDCPAGQFVQNTTNGTGVECSAPAGGGDITGVFTNLDNYLHNGSASGDVYLRFNETLLNETIDARENDTQYTNGTGLNLTGTIFSHNDSSSVADEDNSGNTFIQDMTFDGFGHVLTVVTNSVDFSAFYTSAVVDTLFTSVGNYSAENFTIARTGDCPAGQFVQNTTNGTGVECATPSGGTGKNTSGDLVYNDTTTIYFNRTQADVDLEVNGSDHWDGYNITNSTQFSNTAGALTIIASYLSDVFDSFFSGKTTDDLTQGSTNLYDNQSWNQTLIIGNLTTSGFFVGNGTFLTDVSALEVLWNGNYSTFLTHIDWGEATNGTLAELSTILGFDYYNITDFDIVDYFTSAETITYINANDTSVNTTMKTYVDSQDISFNDSMKTYVDSVATGISWAEATNGTLAELTTILGFNYYNSTDFSISDYFTSAETITYINANDTTFNNSMKTYVDSQDTTFNNSMKTYVDSQDTSFNDSMKTYVDSQDTSFLSTILGFGYYNITNFDIANYVPYTGADTNLDLGANNFSVDTNSFFVDINIDRVGIGTTTPQNTLNVVGEGNFTENLTLGDCIVFSNGGQICQV